MESPRYKALIDEAEGLVAAIRSGVLVHAHNGVDPRNLRAPLESARCLNSHATRIGDKDLGIAADALEMWLGLLAAETEQISHKRTLRLLDQISEVEVALVASKSSAIGSGQDVGDFIEETFDSLRRERSGTECASIEPTDAFEIDAEMLEVFREEAASLLHNIRSSLETLKSHPNDREALWEIKRSSHTFKGAAGVVGLRRTSEIAHRLEDFLDRFSDDDAISNAKLVGLLVEAADCLELLSDKDGSPDLEKRIGALFRGLDEVALNEPDEAESKLPTDAPVQPSESHSAVSKEETAAKHKSSIVRVSLDRLDELVRNVGELLQSRNAFEHGLSEFEQQLEESGDNTLRLKAATVKIEQHDPTRSEVTDNPTASEFRQNAYELAETARDASVIDTGFTSVKKHLDSLFEHQKGLIGTIQERLMKLRNVEFGSIATRLQRTVRVTCDEEGKAADLIIENGALEIDTQVIDALIEPLMHLLKNAVVHGIEAAEIRRILGKPESGVITVNVRRENGHILVAVADDGRGIAFETLVEKAVSTGHISRAEADSISVERLRELMFLPGLTTADQLSLNAGRGIGMSIIRESVEAAGGTVWFETRPQNGTTFFVLLPLPFAELQLRDEAADNIRQPKAHLNVLVVDDSPSVRLTLTRLMERNGWQAMSAKNGVEALEQITGNGHRPDVVLSDIEMPRMGGLELLAAIRGDEQLRDIPVVFISSRSGERERRHALAAGANGYIVKPYDEAEVASIVLGIAQGARTAS